MKTSVKHLSDKQVFTTEAPALMFSDGDLTKEPSKQNGLGDLRFEYFSGYKNIRYAFCKLAQFPGKVIVLVPVDAKCETKVQVKR